MAKEAAGGQTNDVPDQIRWQASLPHLSRWATERRSKAAASWIRDHVRPDTVAESRKGLRVGAPEGANAEVAVEGRRCRGGGGVLRKHESGEPGLGGVGQGQGRREQGWGGGPRAGERGGRAGPALGGLLSFFFSCLFLLVSSISFPLSSVAGR